ncbi:2-C-methyl-D-erythritol 2,4-cyclodiphosphate synthase [Filifactor villosus]|uniref:2-C-methyl-D-erythritol 2,4-cyclodiphosphate synthase n=1 Tax=Filifactor villosus TaxID=29374 RepID=A0ABV9QR38_9FIRM
MKIGFGYDLHRLVEGRKLILAGVEIPYEKGLLGHSDADVLAHAIMDAILGALALGDIGRHFPDTSKDYKDANSMELMKRVYGMMRERGYEIGNIDALIIAQKPKMAPYVEQMRMAVATLLNTDRECVNIKATTTEGLNAEGRGEAISSQVAVLLQKTSQ